MVKNYWEMTDLLHYLLIKTLKETKILMLTRQSKLLHLESRMVVVKKTI
jgi:hypothetical protein